VNSPGAPFVWNKLCFNQVVGLIHEAELLSCFDASVISHLLECGLEILNWLRLPLEHLEIGESTDGLLISLLVLIVMESEFNNRFQRISINQSDFFETGSSLSMFGETLVDVALVLVFGVSHFSHVLVVSESHPASFLTIFLINNHSCSIF